MLRLQRQNGTARQPTSGVRAKAGKCLNTPRLAVWPLVWAIVATPLAIGAPAPGPKVPALRDNMDGQGPVLRSAQRNVPVRILRHELDRRVFRSGTGSEHITLACPAGSSAPLAYQFPPAVVISELQMSVRIRCNRPGVRLAATVMLPRSIDPATGRPLTIQVRGGMIGQGGDWEQLGLGDLLGAVAGQARIARMQPGRQLDERGAVITELLLLVPGGQGATELWVDQIDIFGLVSAQTSGTSPAEPTASQAGRVASAPQATYPAAILRSPQPGVPRIIQWQGEPLQRLADLGFNTVGMGRLPTASELAEAERLGLQIVCPPPTARQIGAEGFGENLAAVTAWDLGQQFTPEDLEQAAQWQQLIRLHDPRESRPTMMAPRLYTRGASRIADLLLVGRGVLGTSLSMRDHATWLNQRQRLARPGTPIWTEIETQLNLRQARQIAALREAPLATHAASYRQLSALTSAAFGVRSQGFYFRSHTSLASDEAGARRRALALELTCLRLQLADPWLATGKLGTAARSTDSNLTGLVLQKERSHLLVPMRWSDDTRTASLVGQDGPISLLVPGVPESSEAYLLSACGAKRLRHKRVTGGIRVSLDHRPTDEFILLTDDPQAFSQVSQHLRGQAPRAAKLRCELVGLRHQDTVRTAAEVAKHREEDMTVQKLLESTGRVLTQCDQLLASKQFDRAYSQANRAAVVLDRVEQLLTTESISVVQSSVAPLVDNPLTASLATLGNYLQLEAALARAPVGPNLLPGGGFESLVSLMNSGWKHHRLTLDGIESAVRLSPEAPRSGSYCLELEALPTDPAAPPAIVSTSPAWVVSVPVQVRAGDLVEITGVVRVPQVPLGSVDGLQIFDSLGGADLAIRVKAAPSWQPFRLIRAATSDAAVTVTIALSGLGVAQVDDVAIRALHRRRAADRVLSTQY